MKPPKNLLILLLALIISFSVQNISFAETATPKKEITKTAVKEQIAPVKAGLCDCLKGAIDAIQKAYVSLEEDEWQAAIKITKDAINTINTVSKNCTCPETIAYQKIADAYLKYAEGGYHLDGTEAPNCPYATKLYSDAIASLETYIPKISNATVKGNAGDVKEYAIEEEQFVKEECGGAKSQPQEKSKGAGETKQQKKQ